MSATSKLMAKLWTWRTGYLAVKMEGESPLSKLPKHIFEYHIGGFKGDQNVMQWVELPLPGKEFEIGNGQKQKLTINVDLNAWFESSYSFRIQETPACTVPGSLAKQFAVNYRNMFFIKDAEGN